MAMARRGRDSRNLHSPAGPRARLPPAPSPPSPPLTHTHNTYTHTPPAAGQQDPSPTRRSAAHLRGVPPQRQHARLHAHLHGPAAMAT